MKYLKTILILFSSLLIILGTNGVIVEKYLCLSCNHNELEVQIFEFGEINHNHSHIHTHNHSETHKCTVKDIKKHLNDSRIFYYSLDLLFVNSFKKLTNNLTLTNYITKTNQHLIYHNKLSFIDILNDNNTGQRFRLIYKSIFTKNINALISTFIF